MEMICVLAVVVLVVLVGLAGLVLLVVGIIKRSAPMWVSGIIGICLAGLAVLAGAAIFIGWHAKRAAVPGVVRLGSGEGGVSVRYGAGQATARAEGVEFTILKPGSGGSGSSSTTRSGIGPGASEARYEIRLGDVHIVVEKRGSRLTLSVNAANYGAIQRGDSVIINEAREVLINGQRRSPW